MWLVVSRGRENGAYLGAVSWVVYNSCLGFLGGGRRHFTMQGRGWVGVGRMGEGEEEGSGKGHQEKMPRNTDKQVRTPPQSPEATVYRGCGAFLALLQSSWPPVSA